MKLADGGSGLNLNLNYKVNDGSPMETFLDEIEMTIDLVAQRQCEVSCSFTDPKSS